MKTDKAYKFCDGTCGWFFQETYQRTFVVLVNVPWGAAIRFVEERYGVDVSHLNESAGRSVIFDVDLDDGGTEPVNMIWIGKFKWGPNELSVLSHECNHAAMDLLEDRNAHMVFNGKDYPNEHFTYLQQEIMRRTLKIIEQHNKATT